MKYSTGKEIKVGDSVKIHHGNGIFIESEVVKIILPNTDEAKDWSAPNGGVLIQDNKIGLTLWNIIDEDLVFVKRK
jgi:hypothetical protein